jgi:hypothetical protein
MSPPEVWGPAVWTLFHTLAEKLNPNAYNQVIPSLFGMIVQICKVLPCPECSRDASNFLAKIKLSDYKNKDEFKNMIYLFHNFVNAKKRKPLYNYANMNKYANVNLFFVVNNFIAKYNTKGNMKLLAESFQRSFVIKNFIAWFNGYKRAFIQPIILNSPQPVQEQTVTEISLEDILPTIEEVSSEESPVEESEEITIEKTVVEEPVVEETVVEETVVEEPVVEEPVVEEPVVEEPVVEETVVEEPVVEVVEEMYNNETISNEDIINPQISTEEPIKEVEIVKEPVKSKKCRKSKAKK